MDKFWKYFLKNSEGCYKTKIVKICHSLIRYKICPNNGEFYKLYTTMSVRLNILLKDQIKFRTWCWNFCIQIFVQDILPQYLDIYAFICRLLLTDDQIDLFIVHLGGLTIDMFGGILLLFDKTRPIALFFLASFHFMNSTMFSIGNYY